MDDVTSFVVSFGIVALGLAGYLARLWLLARRLKSR